MPTPPSPTIDDLLPLLTAATDKNNLQWSKTADEDSFRAELGTWMVRLDMVPASSRFVLSLLDQDGTLLDQFQPSGEGQRIAFEALFKKARTQALKLDWKIKNFYDHLKTLASMP
jgi:hypothetical protein